MATVNLEQTIGPEIMRQFTLTLRVSRPLQFRFWLAMQAFRLGAFILGSGFKREDVAFRQNPKETPDA